jgi:hypothetical protein
MKKVTDLKSREVIHCATQEEAIAICKLLDEAGFRWGSGEGYIYDNRWHTYKEDTCYRPQANSYADIEFYKGEGYKVYLASDFLEADPEFEYGEKILVGDKQPLTLERTFLTINIKNSKWPYVTTNDDGRIYSWKYAKKIAAKPIPEYTMEELQEKLGEEFKIKK